MKAIVQRAHGSPEVLRLAEVDQPAIKDGDVLVRVRASSINAGDYFSMRGSPWLVRLSVGGGDVAGSMSARHLLAPWAN